MKCLLSPFLIYDVIQLGRFSLFYFCLSDLSVVDSGVLESLHCAGVDLYFMKLDAPAFGAYM